MTKKLLLILSKDADIYARALTDAGLSSKLEILCATPDEMPGADDLARVDAFVGWKPPAGALDTMPRLSWLQTLSAGVDDWLTRDDVNDRFVMTAAQGSHRIQMPENILAALFHLTKPFVPFAFAQAERRWERKVSEPLAGKTLGILGLGAIGQEVARKAEALEIRVVGTKRSPGPVAHVDEVHAPDATETVLAQSDFVLLLLPLTAETDNFMDAIRLAQMKSSAYLLNFGRGASVVDDDLVAAVKSGTIAGAVLDVFRTEPLPEDHAFWTTEGITVLPHLGGLHPDRDTLVAEVVVENARRYLADETMLNLVDFERGY